MSIVLDGAAPIERYGRVWKPWTKKQLVELSAKVPVSKVEQIMLSYGDMIRFISSIRGIDAALALAGGCAEADVEKAANVRQRIELAGELIDRMIGEFGSSGEEPSPPLAATGSTGG